MPIGEVVAIGGLVLALLASVYGALAYAFRVGALVTTLTIAIEQLRQKTAAMDLVPVLATKLEQQTNIIDELSRKVSDFPRMRERLDSVNEDVDELRALKVDSRLAVVENRLASTRGMPAQMSRTTIPRKDSDE